MSCRVWCSIDDPAASEIGIYDFLRSAYSSAEALAEAAMWKCPMHVYGLSEQDMAPVLNALTQDHFMELGGLEITQVQVRSLKGGVVKTVFSSR